MVKDEAMAGNKTAIKVVYNYAVALIKTNNLKKAERVFELLVESNGRNVTVLRNYAVVLLRYLGNKKKALDQLNKIKTLSNNKAVIKEVDLLEKEAYEKRI